MLPRSNTAHQEGTPSGPQLPAAGLCVCELTRGDAAHDEASRDEVLLVGGGLRGGESGVLQEQPGGGKASAVLGCLGYGEAATVAPGLTGG